MIGVLYMESRDRSLSGLVAGWLARDLNCELLTQHTRKQFRSGEKLVVVFSEYHFNVDWLLMRYFYQKTNWPKLVQIIPVNLCGGYLGLGSGSSLWHVSQSLKFVVFPFTTIARVHDAGFDASREYISALARITEYVKMELD